MNPSWTEPSLTAQRDLGARREINENQCDTDAKLHRSEASYISLRLPKRPRRPHKSHRKHGHGDKISNTNHTVNGQFASPDSLTPNEQIQKLLCDDTSHGSHDVFCEMDVLYKHGEIFQWRETARWVKYEEDVEECGMRWSKPHVASLSLHSLFELRSCLTTGACMLEMDAHTVPQVADLLLDNLINQKLLEEPLRDKVRSAIVSQHQFQHQKQRRKMSTMSNAEGEGGPPTSRKMSMIRTFSEIGRTFSLKGRSDGPMPHHDISRMRGNPISQPNLESLTNGDVHDPALMRERLNQQFMRKIPEGSEAANILVGELDCLSYQIVAFIRLAEGRTIGEITEVPIPSRYIFLLLGPPGSQHKNVEIGRSMSTIMVDEVFREVAYKARSRQDILAGVDEFLDQVTALPPGEWDPKIRIEPPSSVPSQEPRKVLKQQISPVEEEEEEESHCDPTLQRSGRLFGGLIADVKRKLPWYGSDFKDCLHIQCLASIIYLYLATLTPNVTFGGLLGQATDQYMGTMECILTAAICGVLFALFSGQPLNILGSTGPMLVLEMILYNFCKDNDLDFLPFRAWIGLWTALLLLLVVAFDLSALVRYITRFTEESFASLIALIFIVEAFKKLKGLLKDVPVNLNPHAILNYSCECLPPYNTSTFNVNATLFDVNVNTTDLSGTFYSYINGFNTSENILTYTNMNLTSLNVSDINWTAVNMTNCTSLGGIPLTIGCNTKRYVADAFFLSVLLFIGTFFIATWLSNAKTSSFFPTFVRQTFSDFAVLIAIVSMVVIDILIGIDTPKLEVPTKFKPTSDARGWFINPFSDKNPTYLIFAAVVPALLAVILIFMDQQITAVIVNRKENKLKKGSGYHLDMFVVAICIAICSLLGLPWYVAATVSALAHVMSLKKESECTAPGERPTFLGVREQRVTALMVGLLSGLSVLFTTVLRFIPMAVLYGVFLYMGVAALKGMQLMDRISLFLKPAKYQPDYTYLRHVPIKRVHLFTVIQVVCLVVLWLIKSIKAASIIFPIMVLGTCFVRKFLDYLFSQRELKWLDDLMPEAARKEKEDKKKLADQDGEEKEEDEALLGEQYDKLMEIKVCDRGSHHNGGIYRRGSLDPVDRVNISEEMARTSIWQHLRKDSQNVLVDNEDGLHNRSKKRSRHHDKSNGRSHHGHRHKNNGRHQEQNGSHLENNKDQHDNSSDEPVKDEPVHNENTNNEKDVKKTTFFLMGEEEEDHTV